MIKNPILKGFNPDPSIIRVEDDYYIATSTFEWYPGVQIHHNFVGTPARNSNSAQLRRNTSQELKFVATSSEHQPRTQE